MLTYLLLILGIAALMVGANFLVNGASAIAKKLKISELVIGLTIVAFGTSAPELVVNLVASIQGNTDIALGNIVGSNNFNQFFILGITAMVMPLTVNKQILKIDLPYNFLIPIALLFATILISPSVESGSFLSRSEGALFLIFFIIYYWYTFYNAKEGFVEQPEETQTKQYNTFLSVIMIAGGLTLLFFGAQFTVNSAVTIATDFGVSERVIALTIVAGGTSLPELITSVVAARKGNSDIAIGNVIGSNFFNVFFILAISAIIRPIPVSPSFTLDISMMFLSFIMLFVFLLFTSRGKLTRIEGGIMVLTYVIYLVYMILN